jgi:plastin-1
MQYYQVPFQQAKHFTTSEVKAFKESFATFDDGAGLLEFSDLCTVMKQLGEESDPMKIRALLPSDTNGSVSFAEFADLISDARVASEEQARKIEEDEKKKAAMEQATLEAEQELQKTEAGREVEQAQKNREYFERKQAEEQARVDEQVRIAEQARIEEHARVEEQARIEAEQVATREAEEQAAEQAAAEKSKEEERASEEEQEKLAVEEEGTKSTSPGAGDGGEADADNQCAAGGTEGAGGGVEDSELQGGNSNGEDSSGGGGDEGSEDRADDTGLPMREFFHEEREALSTIVNHRLAVAGGTLERNDSMARVLPIEVRSSRYGSAGQGAGQAPAGSAVGEKPLFSAIADGLVPAKLLNLVQDVAGEDAAIDERAIHRPCEEDGQLQQLTRKERTENMTLFVHAAKAVGCSMDEIDFDAEGASEVGEDGELRLLIPKEELLMGLMWQIEEARLKAEVNVERCPFLARLVDSESDEKLTDFNVSQLLIRWVNFHIATQPAPAVSVAGAAGDGVGNAPADGAGGAAGISMKYVTNFGEDFADGECYKALLQRLHLSQGNTAAAAAIAPDSEGLGSEGGAIAAAEAIIASAKALGAPIFIQPADLISDHEKLHLLFVAQLFKSCPGMYATEEEKRKVADEWGANSSDSREEVVLQRWINLLGLPKVHVRGLFDGDLADGLVILKAMDKVEPGIVYWKRVNMQTPMIKFKRYENCNYVVTLGKQLKFKLVNVGGTDIESGNQKLISTIIWQLMEYHLMKVLRDLSGTGGTIGDKEIIAWANKRVREAGFKSSMKDFNDRTLFDSKFLVDLVRALRSDAVIMAYIMPGGGDLALQNNAKYAISCAHKIGAAVFLSWLDIVEVRPKMIMTYVASLMAVDQAGGIADKKTRALCEALGR